MTKIATVKSCKKGVIPKIMVGAAAVFLCLSSYAKDSQEIKKCHYMSSMIRDIATDRDDGLSYKNRINKNNKLTYDMPDARAAMKEMTNAVYSDKARNFPPDKLAEGLLAACLKDM